MEIVQVVVAVLVYPGLLFTLGLGWLYHRFIHGPVTPGRMAALREVLRHPKTWNSEQGLHLASMALAGVGLALLPCPWNPANPAPTMWYWAWAALEAAFVLPLLPGLLSGAPPAARAAMRAAQIGVSGRALLWMAMAVGLLLTDNWLIRDAAGQSPLVAHILALLAMALVFPIAAGWGPYANITGITPAGIEMGADDQPARELAHAATVVRTAALLAASLVALLPVGVLLPLPGLLLWLSVFIIATTPLTLLEGRTPRMTLKGVLRRCLWRGMPLSLLAVIYLGLLA